MTVALDSGSRRSRAAERILGASPDLTPAVLRIPRTSQPATRTTQLVARAPQPEPDVRNDSLSHPRSERLPVSAEMERLIAGAGSGAASLAALGGGPDSVLAGKLIAALAREPRGEEDLVRERAAWALTRARGGRLVEPLLDALGDPDWRVRAYAAWALALARDRRATTPLVEALGHPVWRMRAMAAAALREIGDPAAERPMIAALDDDAWQVRYSAVQYLGELVRAPGGRPERLRLALLDRLRAMRADRHVAVRSAVEEAVGW
jgi:HEAT repeat protein